MTSTTTTTTATEATSIITATFLDRLHPATLLASDSESALLTALSSVDIAGSFAIVDAFAIVESFIPAPHPPQYLTLNACCWPHSPQYRTMASRALRPDSSSSIAWYAPAMSVSATSDGVLRCVMEAETGGTGSRSRQAMDTLLEIHSVPSIPSSRSSPRASLQPQLLSFVSTTRPLPQPALSPYAPPCAQWFVLPITFGLHSRRQQATMFDVLCV